MYLRRWYVLTILSLPFNSWVRFFSKQWPWIITAVTWDLSLYSYCFLFFSPFLCCHFPIFILVLLSFFSFRTYALTGSFHRSYIQIKTNHKSFTLFTLKINFYIKKNKQTYFKHKTLEKRIFVVSRFQETSLWN